MRALAPILFGTVMIMSGCEKRDAGGTVPPNNTGPTSQPSTAPVPNTGAPKDNIILLGEVGSLTGSEATFGESTKRGVEMAVDEVNAAGGVTLADGTKKLVDVRVYDDQGKPEEAANAVTRLISQDHVKVILGEVASSNSLAMAPKAQAAQTPMITPSSTNVAVTQKGDYIFRVCFLDDFQGKAMAQFAHDTLKVNNVAILKDNKSDYSLGLAKVFSEEFTKMGGKIAGEEAYSKGDTDFRGQLTALKGKKPDAIYVPGYYTDVGVVGRQARELGIKAPLLGGDGWESEKLFELGGSAIEGSYYTNHYSPDDPKPEVQKFVKAFSDKYGSKPESLAALGYDAARVAIAAIARAKDLTGPSIRDEIAKTKDFAGVAGTITLDANRNAVKPAVVLQVKGGKAVYAATVNP
ncbi:MAG TPA: ABC transporter substrate-binding protein [Myxococcota bacterium]|jgi:branched-chain amino acid transport system substrate-binding protein